MVVATQKKAEPPTGRLQHAEELKNAKQIEQAIALYNSVLSEKAANEEVLKEQEFALIHLGQLYRDLG